MDECTIIIPLPRADHPGPHSHFILRLQTRCLYSKSVFLRGLLGGISPLDLMQSLAASRVRPSSVPLHIPRSQLPRLLSPPPSRPVLFLPVPDPSSIQSLFHWMHCGNTDHIENALDQGLIQWEGLARNVEYLCLSTDIKVFLGRWYRSWLMPAQCSPDDDQFESDLESDTSDDDHSPPAPSTDDEMSCDVDCDRGRTRDVKPLDRLCAKLSLCTA